MPEPSAWTTRLQELTGLVVAGLDVDGAVVSLAAAPGSTRVRVAASDDDAAGWDDCQFELGEGPTVETFASGSAVLVPDVAGEPAGRWLGYGAAAGQEGVAAVFAFPLQVGAAFFGALTLYRRTPGPLTRDDHAAATWHAEVATALLVDLAAARAVQPALDSPGIDDELEQSLLSALDSFVHQAQGMVMVQRGVSLTTALTLMRAHAFATGTGLAEIARSIVEDGFVLPTEHDPET